MRRPEGTARSGRAQQRTPLAPVAHQSGARPPRVPPELVPAHVAIVMDGNGRWAKERGLPRTAGHEAGEAALLDVIHGAVEIGVRGGLASRPRALFEGDFVRGTMDTANYDVMPNRRGFVMIQRPADASAAQTTLHVLINWFGVAGSASQR